MQGVLTSRHFLYLVEGDPVARDRLNDSELASRLSYFLWSSMPDDHLFAAARSGALQGDGLKSEVDRMLADGKTGRFVGDFVRQWLQLHRLGMFPPTRRCIPPTTRGWKPVCVPNRSSSSARCSPEPAGRPLYRLGLDDGQCAALRFLRTPRAADGGLSTRRAETGGSSRRTADDGWGTRPDLGRHPASTGASRGVAERSDLQQNTTVAPRQRRSHRADPANGHQITIRQRIEAHAKTASCAACHRNIDPLGLAFDQYDAVGRWRTTEVVPTGIGDNPPVDASGEMPDGRSFKDSVQFKKLLMDDRDQITRAFIEHLCTYALRRVLTVDDRDDIQAILAEAGKNEYRVKDIVRAVATSELLRKR